MSNKLLILLFFLTIVTGCSNAIYVTEYSFNPVSFYYEKNEQVKIKIVPTGHISSVVDGRDYRLKYNDNNLLFLKKSLEQAHAEYGSDNVAITVNHPGFVGDTFI